MSGLPQMDAPGPQPSRRGCGTILFILLGILLLLPGLCVIITAAVTLPTVIVDLPKRLLYGPPLGSEFWPIMALWAALWAICLLISYLGIRLIRRGLS
jgi:hypothetical protein